MPLWTGESPYRSPAASQLEAAANRVEAAAPERRARHSVQAPPAGRPLNGDPASGTGSVPDRARDNLKPERLRCPPAGPIPALRLPVAGRPSAGGMPAVLTSESEVRRRSPVPLSDRAGEALVHCAKKRRADFISLCLGTQADLRVVLVGGGIVGVGPGTVSPKQRQAGAAPVG